MLPSKPKYAYAEDPIIVAVINGLFSFKQEEKALQRLDSIKSQFIQSRKMVGDKSEASPVALWIKGFDITKSEEKDGILGNFAILYVEKSTRGTYTLKAKKIEQEVKYHPQRVRPNQKHPNLGYPIIRAIMNGKEYKNKDDAWEDLLLIHEDFPDATIPQPNKLLVMIYGKKKSGKSGVTRYVLAIKPNGTKGCVITCEENKRQVLPKKMPSKKNTANKTVGKFSSQVLSKKKKPKAKGKDAILKQKKPS